MLRSDACQERRRPINMISDLNRAYVVRLAGPEFCFGARSLLDLPERPNDLAARVENGWRVAFFGYNSLPSLEQNVFRFHRLRKRRPRLDSALIFGHESRHS